MDVVMLNKVGEGLLVGFYTLDFNDTSQNTWLPGEPWTPSKPMGPCKENIP